jgi:AraC-like DNA-binding protein
MAELVRVAALTGYFPAMQALGVDPRPLLIKVGLSRKLLSTPEQMISARAAMELLERSAEATGCRTFSLRMAPSRGLADLGVTSLLIEHEPTLRKTLEALNEYRSLINPIMTVHIEDLGDSVLVRQNLSVSEAIPTRQASELALGVLARLCFLIVGEDWRPEMVCFTSDKPPVSELSIYYRLFRCRAEFNSECDGIVMASRDLDRPSQRADSAMAEHARKLIEATKSSALDGLAPQVEQSILLLLPSGRATIESCAALSGMSVRTLQRSLEAEGASFSGLLHRVRTQLANQYLDNPRLQITDIAGMLGYSSIAAFSRWHQQTFGMPPTDRRKRS